MFAERKHEYLLLLLSFIKADPISVGLKGYIVVATSLRNRIKSYTCKLGTRLWKGSMQMRGPEI